jgi:hypothetical protein
VFCASNTLKCGGANAFSGGANCYTGGANPGSFAPPQLMVTRCLRPCAVSWETRIPSTLAPSRYACLRRATRPA